MTKDSIKQPERATIYVLAADDMVAGAKQLHDRIEAPHAAAERKTVTPTFQSRHIAFKRLPRRVLSAGVLVPFVDTDSILHVGGSQVDRRHNGAGERVGPLSSVNGASGHTTRKIFVVDARHGLRLVRTGDQRISEGNGRSGLQRASSPTSSPAVPHWPVSPRDPRPAA